MSMIWKKVRMGSVYSSVEDYKEALKYSDVYTEEGFYDAYAKQYMKVYKVVDCAKVFIVENWEKVDDWSGLEFTVQGANNNEPTEYYNYDKHEKFASRTSNDVIAEAYQRMDEENEEKHNPVESVTKVVLDPSDGDFSITVNGVDYNWIDEEPIIEMAHYIEYKLEQKKNEQ